MNALPGYDHWKTTDTDGERAEREVEAVNAMDDAEIGNLLAEAGVEDSLLEAAIYAVRNQDFGYLQRQYARLAGPVIEAARLDVAQEIAA